MATLGDMVSGVLASGTIHDGRTDGSSALSCTIYLYSTRCFFFLHVMNILTSFWSASICVAYNSTNSDYFPGLKSKLESF